MILINRNEVDPVATDILSRRGGPEAGEPYIAIDETDYEQASEGAGEILAIVQKADMSLEQMAESASREIAYVMKKETDAVFSCLVSINCLADILMSELCIVSDMLRNAVGDSKVKFGIKCTDTAETRSISVLLFRK